MAFPPTNRTVWAGGVLAVAGIAAWFWNTSRSLPIDQRTRDRLAPPTPASDMPSAAEIHVGTMKAGAAS